MTQHHPPEASTPPRPEAGHRLTWFTIYFPPSLDLAGLTSLLRPLAYRPRIGLLGRTPQVVIELRVHHGAPYWLLGVEPVLAASLPDQLRAQLPQLLLAPAAPHLRPSPSLASSMQLLEPVRPLRLDLATSVSAAMQAVLQSTAPDEVAMVQWVIGPTQRTTALPPTPTRLGHLLGFTNRQAAPREQHQQWRRKLAEPLFAVHGRIGARTAHPERTAALLRDLAQAISLASASQLAMKTARPSRRSARRMSGVPRWPTWSGALNAAELATLLGYPFDVPGTTARQAAAAPAALLLPASAPHAQHAVRVLGRSRHPADEHRLVTMPVETALHHVHVTGVTGSGKSTQLASFLRADMNAGHSVLLIEPRGDLVEDVLRTVPAVRRDDVVVLEPGRSDAVVGLNPLAGPLADAERRADLVMHVFRQVFGSSIGPRSADVLLHALIALARHPDGTLVDLPILLTNATYRRRVLSTVTDPLVLAPFFAWFDQLSDAERTQVIAPVLNKTRSFLSRSPVRHLVGQAQPQFTIEELFTSRRIVLVNLNVGVLGTEAAALIGALLVTQLWQAIQRRAVVPRRDRHPVMVVIDEFQDYLKLPVDVGDLLAQARALGVSLTAAHQHLGQLSPSLKAAFMANARSRVAFQPSSDDVQELARAFGTSAAATDLTQLGRFEAYCRLVLDNAMTAPFIVGSRPLGVATSSPEELRRVSQQRYGTSGAQLDAGLIDRWRSSPDHADTPIGLRPRKRA